MAWNRKHLLPDEGHAVNALLLLQRQFRGAQQELRGVDRPSPQSPVHVADVSTPAAIGLFEGSLRYYPLELTGVCLGSALYARFNGYAQGGAVMPVRYDGPDLKKEEQFLRNAERVSPDILTGWNAIQVSTALYFMKLLPPKPKAGVPQSVVDSFHADKADIFRQKLTGWILQR